QDRVSMVGICEGEPQTALWIDARTLDGRRGSEVHSNLSHYLGQVLRRGRETLECQSGARCVYFGEHLQLGAQSLEIWNDQNACGIGGGGFWLISFWKGGLAAGGGRRKKQQSGEEPSPPHRPPAFPPFLNWPPSPGGFPLKRAFV